MKERYTLWLLLVIGIGSALAGDEPVPDTDFLEFLGSLEADDDWEAFFDSMPEEMVDRQASAEIEDDELE